MVDDVPPISETESSLTEQEAKVLFRMREPNNRVSLNEITKLVNDVIGILDGESALKSGSGRRVNSMTALVADNRPALKSGDFGDIKIPDTLAYILNFNDSLGFAIVSADTRIDNPVLAFTGSGSLIDETDNPGIAIFLERMEDYILNSIVEAERQRDSLLDDIMEKLNSESNTKASLFVPSQVDVIETSRELVNRVSPLVRVEWGQEEPFNDNVGGNCAANWRNPKGNYPAGCVAVAVAHIMSYWRHPSNINGFSFNWTELNKYTGGRWWRINTYPDAANQSLMYDAPVNARNQVANLFEQIGRGVKMNYGCGGSGTTKSNSVDFLSRQGFRTGGVRAYDSSIVITSLNNRRPLMAAGCSHRTSIKILGITLSSSYSGCHQWVIDGYLRYRVTFSIIMRDHRGAIISQMNISGHLEYLHNNWGWDGRHNGYFLSGIFDSNLTPINSNTTKSGEPRNYQYKIEIVPNIHR